MDVVFSLLSPTAETSCASVSSSAGVVGHLSRAYTAAMSQADFLEDQLTKELQNARLFRLMVKLGFVNERPESAHQAHTLNKTREHGTGPRK